nr:MAG TPA: hypothetical protein [Bacteriophage sp.]
MYTVAKILFDHKCIYSVRDFENARDSIQGNLKIKFLKFNYHDKSQKILQAFGIIHHPKFGRIQVSWNYEGKAFIANEHFPEFDIPVKNYHNQVSR